MYQSGRSVEELERQPAVRAGQRFVRALSSGFHDLRIIGAPALPRSGGAIIVCNHTSSLDPVFLQAACPRLITWMMAREYATIFGTQWFFRAIEPILVARSGRDTSATREALRALESGKILGIFPEGRIETAREILPFQSGVSLLAIKAQAPVIPAALDGTQRDKGMVEAYLRPQQAELRFGAALQLHRSEGHEGATRRIRQAVADLAQLPLCETI